jgi:PPOX class probable F420-dependent enzyme
MLQFADARNDFLDERKNQRRTHLEAKMAEKLPDKYADLLGSKKAFANLGTLNSDGSPQVTPVWVDYDGKHVRINSARGRQKDKNIARDPRVSLSIQDPENPYRYLEIRGKVVEATEKGADDHINSLAKKYLGKDVYPFRQPGEKRVIYKIEPHKFSAMG